MAAAAAPQPTPVPAVAPLSLAASAPSEATALASGEAAPAFQAPLDRPALAAGVHAWGEAVVALLVLASQVPAVVAGNLAAEPPEHRIPPAGVATATVEAQARTGCPPAHPVVTAGCTSVRRRPARLVAAAPWTVWLPPSPGMAAMR